MSCWQSEPETRPSFSDLTHQLKGMENQDKVDQIEWLTIEQRIFGVSCIEMLLHHEKQPHSLPFTAQEITIFLIYN